MAMGKRIIRGLTIDITRGTAKRYRRVHGVVSPRAHWPTVGLFLSQTQVPSGLRSITNL
jgi:hypothetical protein